MKPLFLTEDFYDFSYPKYGKCKLVSSPTRSQIDGHPHRFLLAEPPMVEVAKGGYGDLIAFDIPQIFCISEKLKQMFEKAKVSGVEYVPVTVKPKFPHPDKVQRYWQVIILGWGGRIPQPTNDCGFEELERFYETESGERPKTIERFRVYDGLTNDLPVFDRQQWDGSDFFHVWPIMGTTFVTKKVAILLHEAKVKHFSLVPISEFRLPEIDGIACNTRVVPLSCYYPLERANEIGDPLASYDQ